MEYMKKALLKSTKDDPQTDGAQSLFFHRS